MSVVPPQFRVRAMAAALVGRPERMALALSAAIVLFAGAWLYARAAAPVGSEGEEQSQTLALPKLPPPLLLRPLPPRTAIAINRAMPFSREPNPPAAPMEFKGDAASFDRALSCLTTAIYYEAASEPRPGQQAVAQVILNRARHPAFPQSICEVVYQGSTLPTGCQFSFTCDGALNQPAATREWRVAESVAKEALAGGVFPPVGYATHYHADFVVPYWNTALAKNAVVGRHIFYRWPGVWGQPRAFRKALGGVEPDPILLRAIALAARQQRGRSRAQALPRPRVEVTSEPKVELLSIVSILAQGTAPVEADTSYAHAVRKHFEAFADHRVVQMFAERIAKDPQFGTKAITAILRPTANAPAEPTDPESAAAFAAALQDFAEQSDFDTFFKAQQKRYDSIAAQYDPLAANVAQRFQAYTGMSAGDLRIIVAPLLAKSWGADCATIAQPRAILLRAGKLSKDDNDWPQVARTEAILSMVLAQRRFGPADCRRSSSARARCDGPATFGVAMRKQIAEALAARIAPSVQRDRQLWPPSSFPYAATIAESLTEYEANRRWFPTLSGFYPVVVEAVARARALAEAEDKAKRSPKRRALPRPKRGEQSEADEPLVCV